MSLEERVPEVTVDTLAAARADGSLVVDVGEPHGAWSVQGGTSAGCAIVTPW